MEYARRQEAARKQQARAQAHDTRQAAPNQQSVDDLTAWMGGLGYGQSAPDPAQLQAATEFSKIQRRLHDAEQALTADQALRAQQAHQQSQHPPPLPQQPQHPPAPPPQQPQHLPPPLQHPGPSWGNGGGHYDGQAGHRACGGPIGAEYSDKFAEWERKEELKAHRIELFDGKADLEGLQKWFRSVEHYGRLAGYSERGALLERTVVGLGQDKVMYKDPAAAREGSGKPLPWTFGPHVAVYK